MDNEQIAQLTARLDALEAENNQLKASNLELSAEIEIWRPTQRVEIAKPQDTRKPSDFANPAPKVKQFKLADVAAMESGALRRAIKAHLEEQLPAMKDKLSPTGFSSLANGFYLDSLVGVVVAPNDHVRRNALAKVRQSLGVSVQKGFVPFISLEGLE